MNSQFKKHLNILFAYVASYFIAAAVGTTLVLTICNAIFDVESGASVRATNLIIDSLFIFGAFVIMYVRRKRDDDDRRAYLALMKEQEFEMKKDITTTFNDRKMWAEVIFVTIISFIFSLYSSIVLQSIGQFIPYFFIAVPLFIGFELLGTAILHKAWIREDRNF